jgi:hypothetical protein
MAGKAVFGEDRADVAVEANGIAERGSRQAKESSGYKSHGGGG